MSPVALTTDQLKKKEERGEDADFGMNSNDFRTDWLLWNVML